jgi:hypothetical protein
MAWNLGATFLVSGVDCRGPEKNLQIRFVCYFPFVHKHGIMHIFELQNYFTKPYFIAKTNPSLLSRTKVYFVLIFLLLKKSV